MDDGDDVETVDAQLSAFSRQLWYDASSWLMAKEVKFQWKNPDFLLRNPDFLLKNA